MIDREKVIKGLECCSFAWNILEPPNCKNCPYADAEFGTCQIPVATLIDDTLELLKADQAELIRQREHMTLTLFELLKKFASLDRIAKSDGQKALLGRVLFIIENMIEENKKECNQ